MDGKEHHHAQPKLKSCQKNGTGKEQPVGEYSLQIESSGVVLKFIECAKRVDGLDKSGEDKRGSQKHPASVGEQCFHSGLFFFFVHLDGAEYGVVDDVEIVGSYTLADECLAFY